MTGGMQQDHYVHGQPAATYVQGLLDPEHGEMCKGGRGGGGLRTLRDYKGVNNVTNCSKCSLISPMGNPQGVYLQGWLGGPVTISERPPNCLVYTEHTVIGTLQSFHTLGYFTWNLSHGDTCPFQPGFHPLRGIELRPIKALAFILESSAHRWPPSP
jgi:hypothetical protein